MRQICPQRPVPSPGQVVHPGYQRGPTYDFPAVPVDDGREIRMAAVKFDVSDVDMRGAHSLARELLHGSHRN